MNWHYVSWIAVNCVNCPTGMIFVAIQFMEQREKSWRSQFMMRQHQFIYKNEQSKDRRIGFLLLLLFLLVKFLLSQKWSCTANPKSSCFASGNPVSVKFVLRTSEVKFAHTSPSGETSLTKWTSLSKITSLAQRANLVSVILRQEYYAIEPSRFCTGICSVLQASHREGRSNVTHTACGILPCEQMTVGRARTIRLAESKMRAAIPIAQKHAVRSRRSRTNKKTSLGRG